MTYGRHIPVTDGKKPQWFSPDEDSKRIYVSGTVCEGRVSALARMNWYRIKSIALPEDHWVYKALDAGFEPWRIDEAGTKPEDLDPTQPLLLGRRHTYNRDVTWEFPAPKHPFEPIWTSRDSIYGQVIGYHKKAKAMATVPIMTGNEIGKLADELGWPVQALAEFAEHLGILKADPTPEDRVLERFPSLSLGDISTIREILKV